MKKKKLWVLAVLLLVASFGVYTYSRYTSSFEGTGTVDVAKWSVKLTDGSAELAEDFSLELTVAENANAVDGKFAPGGSATGNFVLDLSGTEVSTEYTIDLDSANLPAGVALSSVKVNGSAVELTAGSYSAVVTHEAIATDGEIEVEVTVEWTNDEANNETDTEAGETLENLSIPVTLTAKQYLG